ncbi:MBL fold metallo-hydrolase RNA specificity domain-containing protein [Arenibaculum pallidiluteum]|uniref:MBL fold metallo-hydrolase RNA specificity domain-containing protein n=1 Tax=Arenibaculum pallidiluteum TaxID=2812559 RepID=UPI001A958907|nr:MBL fold metallo-hydrolase [Arenibaculum pallidiluteum]
MLDLTSLGGAGTVTGSKHLLDSGGHRLLVDCGLFQGLKNLRERNWGPFPIDPGHIDAVVLTHAHLDHSGYLPKLVREGYRGRIYASRATRDLAGIILRDSGHLQEKDAEYANRKGFSKHHPALPLYGVREAELALERFSPVEMHAETDLPGGARLKLRPAGHILGAASAEIRWQGTTLVFSGDLGRYGDEVMLDPEPVAEADYVIIESTYGDRVHGDRDAAEAIGSAVERTVARGGTVVIPTFAVGRAQSLLHTLWKLRQAGRLRRVPIYVDSPMAISAGELLRVHRDEHRLPPAVCAAVSETASYVREAAQSKALSASPVPKVILSASGMATDGRVLHHLKAFAPDPKNMILFSGFQAEGTRGRDMLRGAREVKIHGQWIPIRAEIADLPMLSAHADSDELVRWLSGFRRPPRRVFVVHGEPSASEALQARIVRELGWDSVVSAPMERYAL